MPSAEFDFWMVFMDCSRRIWDCSWASNYICQVFSSAIVWDVVARTGQNTECVVAVYATSENLDIILHMWLPSCSLMTSLSPTVVPGWETVEVEKFRRWVVHPNSIFPQPCNWFLHSKESRHWEKNLWDICNLITLFALIKGWWFDFLVGSIGGGRGDGKIRDSALGECKVQVLIYLACIAYPPHPNLFFFFLSFQTLICLVFTAAVIFPLKFERPLVCW